MNIHLYLLRQPVESETKNPLRHVPNIKQKSGRVTKIDVLGIYAALLKKVFWCILDCHSFHSRMGQFHWTIPNSPLNLSLCFVLPSIQKICQKVPATGLGLDF